MIWTIVLITMDKNKDFNKVDISTLDIGGTYLTIYILIILINFSCYITI